MDHLGRLTSAGPQQPQQPQPGVAAAQSQPQVQAGLPMNGLVVQQAVTAAQAAAGQHQGVEGMAVEAPRNTTSPIPPPIPKPSQAKPAIAWPPTIAGVQNIAAGYDLGVGGTSVVAQATAAATAATAAAAAASQPPLVGAAPAAPPPAPMLASLPGVGGLAAAGAAAAATTAAAGAGVAAVPARVGKRARSFPAADPNKRAREMQLRDFLLSVEEYGSTVPGEATRFHLQRGGLTTSNSQIVTLMSLAADHLVANIVHESALYRNLRLQRPGEQGREDAELGGDEGQMLTNEDLSMSLVSRGIHVSDSGLLVKRAGPAAVAAETDAAGDAGADED